MHIRRPQITRDGCETRVTGLQPAHLAGREHTRGPVGARNAGREEQSILFVVFGAAHPGGGHQHQRRGDQSKQKRVAAQFHVASFTGS